MNTVLCPNKSNEEKRIEFCKGLVMSNDLDFQDVIWTDKCSVQLELHREVTYHRKGEPARMCSRPKHLAKVHVCVGGGGFRSKELLQS